MRQQNILYALVAVAALVLVWLISAAQGDAFTTAPAENQQILIDGKVPPLLSDFPMHMAFIDEATCLRCHQDGKEMEFGGQKVIATKVVQ